MEEPNYMMKWESEPSKVSARPAARNALCVCNENLSRYRCVGLILLIGVFAGSLMNAYTATASVLYQTSFEPGEGYNTSLDLVGQNGWLGAGSGGNGLVSGFIPGRGQHAYVGFTPPTTSDVSLFVYHPINTNLQQARFSVTMAIIDSSTTNRDDFYWSVFNRQGHQLFTVDFDNYELNIYYYLDGKTNRTSSGLSFTNGGAYQLSLALDFSHNQWSASLDGALIATNQPITMVGASLNLGDIDAAWVVFDPDAPGDNFMVFDDYQISTTVPAVPQPQLTVVEASNNSLTLRVTGGVPDKRFSVEASTNFVNWLPLQTNLTTGGFFDYVADVVVGLPARFYRARWVP
jgi:hypothetical protein